jgi:hypothetical protein
LPAETLLFQQWRAAEEAACAAEDRLYTASVAHMRDAAPAPQEELFAAVLSARRQLEQVLSGYMYDLLARARLAHP